MVRGQCKSNRWQMFFKIGVRPATLLKRDYSTGAQVFCYKIYEIFRNTFIYRRPLLWWLLMAVNSKVKVYAAEKEMIYLNGASKASR